MSTLKSKLSLLVAGYSMEDIAKVAEMGFDDEDIKSITKKGLTIDQLQELTTEPEKAPEDPKPEVKEEKKEEEPDYKRLYEETKGKLDKAHSENINKDIKPSEPAADPEQALLEWAAEFMK